MMRPSLMLSRTYHANHNNVMLRDEYIFLLGSWLIKYAVRVATINIMNENFFFLSLFMFRYNRIKF